LYTTELPGPDEPNMPNRSSKYDKQLHKNAKQTEAGCWLSVLNYPNE